MTAWYTSGMSKRRIYCAVFVVAAIVTGVFVIFAPHAWGGMFCLSRVCLTDVTNFPKAENGTGRLCMSKKNYCIKGSELTPVDGYYRGWGPCSAACGPGVETAVDCSPPRNGGAACPVPAPTRSCNLRACPIIDYFRVFGGSENNSVSALIEEGDRVTFEWTVRNVQYLQLVGPGGPLTYGAAGGAISDNLAQYSNDGSWGVYPSHNRDTAVYTLKAYATADRSDTPVERQISIYFRPKAWDINKTSHGWGGVDWGILSFTVSNKVSKFKIERSDWSVERSCGQGIYYCNTEYRYNEKVEGPHTYTLHVWNSRGHQKSYYDLVVGRIDEYGSPRTVWYNEVSPFCPDEVYCHVGSSYTCPGNQTFTCWDVLGGCSREADEEECKSSGWCFPEIKARPIKCYNNTNPT